MTAPSDHRLQEALTQTILHLSRGCETAEDALNYLISRAFLDFSVRRSCIEVGEVCRSSIGHDRISWVWHGDRTQHRCELGPPDLIIPAPGGQRDVDIQSVRGCEIWLREPRRQPQSADPQEVLDRARSWQEWQLQVLNTLAIAHQPGLHAQLLHRTIELLAAHEAPDTRLANVDALLATARRTSHAHPTALGPFMREAASFVIDRPETFTQSNPIIDRLAEHLRHLSLASVLDALLGRETASTLPPGTTATATGQRSELTAWTGWWIQAHRRISAKEEPTTGPEGVEHSQGLISRILARRYAQASEDTTDAMHDFLAPKAINVHTRLRLWLLWKTADTIARWLRRPERRAHHWKGLEAYAWLMRETLRELAFGDRATFRIDADRLRVALARLVAVHALKVVGLDPALLLEQHLDTTAAPGGPDYAARAGVAQHTLEVYLAGHFILDTRYGDEGVSTVAGLLAGSGHGQGSEGAQRLLLQSFSLAALFHDSERTSLAGRRASPPSYVRLAPDLAAELDAAHARQREVGSRILAQAVTDLHNASLFASSPEQKALYRWLERLPVDGRGVHDVLSAWGLLAQARAVGHEHHPALGPALRAILLHEADGVVVDGAQDPAALVLVLCDTLFEWDPAPPPSRGSRALAHASAVLASDVGAYRSNALEIDWAGRSWGPDGPRVQGPHLHFHVHLWPDLGRDGEVPLVWLAATQNLLRIRWGDSTSNSGPQIRLSIRSDAGARAWLDAAAGRLGGPAQAGLIEILRSLRDKQLRPGDRRRCVHWSGTADEEVVTLTLLGESLWTGDIRACFPELRRHLQATRPR